MKPRWEPFLVQLEGDELGSGMGESAQWNLRNHKDKDGQFPKERQSPVPFPGPTDLKVETSPHDLKSLDSLSSHLCFPGQEEKQGHTSSIFRPPPKEKAPTIIES